MKNKNVQRRPIDEARVDKQLKRLFSSVRYGMADPLLVKYRSRFNKGLSERGKPIFFETKNNVLSLGKKLEILCLYGDYRLVKVDRKPKAGQNVVNNSDTKTIKQNSKVFDNSEPEIKK